MYKMMISKLIVIIALIVGPLSGGSEAKILKLPLQK